MDIYLAGEHPVKNGTQCKTWKGCNILESFYYVRKNIHFSRLYYSCDNFLLDSGAFTFLQDKSQTCNWDVYVEDYAKFIKKYNVERFFELDIDSIVGLKEVERLRAKLEKLTNKKPIPVWHKSRGKDYFLQMCDNYPYVALGGIAIKEIPRQKYESAFPWFIHEAHKRGVKIHGLGYTGLTQLYKFKFDSIDSTAWLHGNRGGYLYIFNPKKGTIDKIEKRANQRLKPQESAMHNFKEWVKFSQYAELYL